MSCLYPPSFFFFLHSFYHFQSQFLINNDFRLGICNLVNLQTYRTQKVAGSDELAPIHHL